MESDFASTAYTIARHVAKLATSSWRNAMTKRECARAVLRLSCDEQLVAGIGGAVAHFGQRAGLGDADLDSLAATLEEFCRRTVSLLNGEKDTLLVSIEDFQDRIEIVIEHPNHALAGPGSEPLVGTSVHAAGGRMASVELICTLDRRETEFDVRRGILRTRMVKYIGS
jgi:hypothetical protein